MIRLLLLFFITPLLQLDAQSRAMHKHWKEYTTSILDGIDPADSLKLCRCREKEKEFIRLRQNYQLRLDSAEALAAEANQAKGKYFYYVTTEHVIYFDWDDCNKIIASQGDRIFTYEYIQDSSIAGIDSRIMIRKEERSFLPAGWMFYTIKVCYPY